MSSGTLNSTIPYHTVDILFILCAKQHLPLKSTIVGYLKVSIMDKRSRQFMCMAMQLVPAVLNGKLS